MPQEYIYIALDFYLLIYLHYDQIKYLQNGKNIAQNITSKIFLSINLYFKIFKTVIFVNYAVYSTN